MAKKAKPSKTKTQASKGKATAAQAMSAAERASRTDAIKAAVASRKAAARSARKAKRQAAKQAMPVAEDPPPRPPVKCPLTARELESFRQMLLDKRRELVGDMNGIEAEALKADRQEVAGDISDHPADAGTDNFEQEFSLGLLESERVILADIDDALWRIAEGTYGVCLGTGRPISKARLKARPWSKYCIDYARMVEKGLVRPGETLDEE